MLEAADGVAINATHLPRLAAIEEAGHDGGGQDGGARDGRDGDGRALAVVVAHGFTGSWRRPAVRRILAGLVPYAGVVAIDLRGHGGSAGVSTCGALEILDVDAAVAWARRLGYQRVVTCGFSLGGAVVVRHAALHRGVDAVVSVSAPSRWYIRDTRPMRRVHRLIEHPVGRMVARVALHTRISSAGWVTVPEQPVDVAARIAPIPLLIVHGDRDAYLGTGEALALAEAAGDSCSVWIEHGFGHAESGMTPALLDRLGRYVRDLSRIVAPGEC